MHDALSIGIPTLAVLFGALLNNARLSDVRSNLNAFRAGHRSDIKEVRDKLEVLGERVAKLETLPLEGFRRRLSRG